MVDVPFGSVKRPYDKARAHGIVVDWKQLVDHHLAGGNLASLIDGIAYVNETGAKLSLEHAFARQLVAQFRYQMTMRQYLEPFIQSGIKDLDNAPL